MYKIADRSGLAIKVYSAPLTHDRAQKITILSQWDRQELDKFTAWPSGLVLDDQRRPRGLLLPLIDAGKDIHDLYVPTSRRQYFPNADWRFLVHVAGNVARAFAAVHARGLVIGDVNPGSVLVLPDGTVRLIDVDSFQVPMQGGRPLLCTVGVPQFLPPELGHAPLNSVVRTTDHDAFGLAVTVFLLLMLGRHPYAGRYLGTGDMPIEKAILEDRFAYGSRAGDRQMQRPPNTVGLEIVSPSMAAMFEAAFSPPRGQRSRPSAEDWARELGRISTSLARCARNPTHQHLKDSALCPWCALEQSSGVLLFGIVVTQSLNHETEYKRLLGLIAAVPTPSPLAPLLTVAPMTASPAARAASRTPPSTWALLAVGALLSMAGIAMAQQGWAALLLPGLGALIVAVIIRGRPRRPWIRAYRAAHRDYTAAAAQLDQANRFPQHTAAKTAIAQAKNAWLDIPRLRDQRFAELHRNKRQELFQQHLQARPIRAADIKGIGSARVTTLSLYGINTAWDVSQVRVMQVPQFGPVLTDRLLAWRQSIERSFIYNPSTPLPKEAVARVEMQIEEMRRQTVVALRHGLNALEAAASTEPAAAAEAAGRVTAAASAFRQAEVDVVAAIGRTPRL